MLVSLPSSRRPTFQTLKVGPPSLGPPLENKNENTACNADEEGANGIYTVLLALFFRDEGFSLYKY